MTDVGHFEAACAAMQEAHSARAAAEYLQALRASPAAMEVARRVLQVPPPCASTPAQLQAVLLLRDVLLRNWASLGPERQQESRAWLLQFAVERATGAQAGGGGGAMEPVVLRNLVVLIAVTWKRSWLELEEGGKQALLQALAGLVCSADRRLQLLGVHLGASLIQECDGAAGSKATAIGLSEEQHRRAATAFQETGLREVFGLVAQQLVGALQRAGLQGSTGGAGQQGPPPFSPTALDVPLVGGMLGVLSEALAWDFTGRGARSSGGAARNSRLRPLHGSPGKAWRPLLCDAGLSVASSLAALYGALRAGGGGPGMGADAFPELALPTRGLLCTLCCLRPDLFPPEGSGGGAAYTSHMRLLTSTLVSWLEEPALLHRARAATAASSSGGGQGAAAASLLMEGAIAEAQEAAEGLNAVLWAAGAHTFAGGVPDPGCALSAATRFALGLLESVHGVAAQVHAAIEGANGAAAAAAGGGAGPAAAAQLSQSRAVVRRTRDALQTFLDERYEGTCEAVDSFLELWTTLLYGLGDEALGGGGGSSSTHDSSSSNNGSAAGDAMNGGGALPRLVSTARDAAAALYEAAVTSRLSFSSALVRVGIDDDDPFVDDSLFDTHMEYLAAIGRFVPAAALPLLTRRVGEVHRKLRAHAPPQGAAGTSRTPGGFRTLSAYVAAEALGASGAGQGVLAGDVDAELGAINEEAWWLVSFTGYLLCDAAKGETPLVPASLNQASLTSLQGQGQLGHGGAASPPSPSAAEAVTRDPIVSLTTEVLALLQFEVSRALGGGGTSDQSPLLTQQLLWFTARWARTYLLPDPDAYRGLRLCPVLLAAYGPPPAPQLQDTPTAAVLPNGLRPVPVSPLPGCALAGGRAVLEFALQSAVLALGAWGGGLDSGESGVSRAAIWTLRAICNNEVALAWAVVSPTWAMLVEAVTAGTLAAPGAPPAPSPSSLAAEAAACAPGALQAYPHPAWGAAIRHLGRSGLPPESRGALFAALLTATRAIGQEAEGGPPALAHRETLLELLRGDSGGAVTAGEGAVAEVTRVAGREPAALLSRWRSYYITTLLSPVSTIVAASAGAHPPGPLPLDPRSSAAALGAGGTAPGAPLPKALCARLDALLCLLTATVNANTRLPDAWHLPLTVPALRTAALIVDAVRGAGPLGIRALRFCVEFLDTDLLACSPPQARAVHAAIGDVFRAFAAHHRPPEQQRQQQQSAVGAAGGAGARRQEGGALLSRRAAAAAAAEEEEASLHDDLLALLKILEKLVEKEDVQFSGGGGSGEEGDSGASHAVLTGLRLLLPMLTPSLLQYPRVTAAFVGVVSELVSGHPAQCCGLDSPTFGAFVGVLEHGARSLDPDVVSCSLGAVKALAAFHGACTKKRAKQQQGGGGGGGGDGGAVMLGLGAQAAAAPDLFSRLTTLVLIVVLSGPPPDRLVIPAAGEALHQLVAAEPAAFQATVLALLRAQPSPETSSRLAAEFTILTSGGGVTEVASRPNRVAFVAAFGRFVDAVRDITTFR